MDSTDFTLGYREVIPDQTVLDNWIEITLSTGGTQSTLQDIKVAERANGFCYRDSTKRHTSNRFIYWRISYDVLELVEHSLDVNLSGNHVRYKFIDTPILDGVSIHETDDNVLILVPTVCSVHRLIFPHPDKYHTQDDLLGTHPDLAAPSIFSKASTAEAGNPKTFCVFNSPSTAIDQLPNLASSYLDIYTEEAIFVLAYPSTELLLVKLAPNGQTHILELRSESLVPKFLSSLTEKFRQKNSDSDNIVNLLIQVINDEIYVLTLCRDGLLKFWSCSRGQCIAVINILAETGDIVQERMNRAILRSAVDGDEECILSVFTSFSTGSQFHILKPIINGQQVSIIRLNTLRSPESDLIDFALQRNRLWSAWRCENGDCAIYTASLNTLNYAASNWSPVILETLPDANHPPNIDGETDPRQVYLQHIFHPGRFPLHVISKALCIYKRSTILSDTKLSISVLKQKICMAVENEIQTSLNEAVVNDEEYLECANWCWQKFYSCCVQYHIAGLKPLGILLLPSVSGAVFLKKSTFSFLRPLEPIEHLVLCYDYVVKDHLVDIPFFAEDIDSIGDIINLFEVIAYLQQQTSEIFSYTFEKELSVLHAPDVVTENLLEKIKNEMDSEFTDYVASMLNNCDDLYQAIHKVLELLRYDNLLPDVDPDMRSAILHHFSSQLGISMVAGCLRQQAEIRFIICRSLLLITNILLNRKELDWGLLEAIRSVCNPDIVVLTQASYVSVWLSGLPALVNLPQDYTMQRLAPLKLTPVFNIRINSMLSVSLLELFTGSTGGQEARKSFMNANYNSDTLAHWHLSLLPFLNHLRHIIMPISGNTTLAEWLLSSGQHLWLQQYVRLLGKWCEWNNCTRLFLLGASYLTTGENYKAQELFQLASEGIFTDPFLQNRILKNVNDDKSRIYVTYYLKVIQLFELHKARDFVINIANTTLSIVDECDPLTATLYSIKFKHHLALRHYQQAFDSLNSNPDSERKKDNLRDLVKTLLDEKKLDILLNFTYESLDEFFSNILLTRARATDGVNNIYYDFLYSYQIKRGPLCHRLAASIMYEQAFRLMQYNTMAALEKQVKCYLAAKNILQLCDPKHAWVVRPADPNIESEEVFVQPTAGSLQELEVLKLRSQVEVIDVNTIKNDLLLASGKLKLAAMESSYSVNVTSPSELVLLLNNAGLFKTALEICTTFKISYESVFEALTKHCILVTEEEYPNALDWLVENDLQDLPVNRDSVADVVWQLLQDYLEKYEEENMTTLHYVICKKIINMGMYIPHWLLSSYKKRNASELLKLLHSTGRLDEATTLVKEYLSAALGYGKEYYGIKQAMDPTAPLFCLPVYPIKCLIQELEIQNLKNVDKPYEKEYQLLKHIFEDYLKISTRITNEMTSYRRATVR